MIRGLQALLSADFLDERGTLIFPDIALDAIAGAPHISHRFLERYAPEYEPAQLQDADVLLSLKPKVLEVDTAGRLVHELRDLPWAIASIAVAMPGNP